MQAKQIDKRKVLLRNEEKDNNLSLKDKRVLTGDVTLPSQENFYDETLEMLELLGADALRNSDGTVLPENLKDLEGVQVYTNFFPARGHNTFVLEHLTECSRFYLSGDFVTAESSELTIHFMSGYFGKQLKPDYDHNPYEWWEIINRTTGEVVDKKDWSFNPNNDTVTIKTIPFQVYSVSFLAYGVWDPVHMYNHITNDWGEAVEPDLTFDVRYPASSKFALQAMEQWLIDNPKTDVVRFTTFFYQFSLIFNNEQKEKYVDWFGYTNTVSPRALEDFAKEYGYRLRPEDFVDQGYYNSTFRIPSKHYLDYMDFQQRFVAKKAKALVDLVHQYHKKAIMFLGDQWIGTEPYGKYFSSIGLDGVVGSVGDGVTLRLIADIDVKIREGRFLPYFFPDTFFEGNDEAILEEAKANWIQARRALFRHPLTRIGYGGYLSLAYPFKDFIRYIAEVTREFREIKAFAAKNHSLCKATIAILNAWGEIRTWSPYIVAHGKPYKLSYSYLGMMEALSGLAVNVKFISFEDLKAGIDEDIDIIINAGDAGTAFSGGTAFADAKVITVLRRFVYEGGGLIGVGDPTALQANGRFFQLADVFGLDKEIGFSQSTDKYHTAVTDNHFILADVQTKIDFGESKSNIYALSAKTEILEYSNDEVHMAVNRFGKGRAFYMAGMPYSLQNTRILQRAISYVMGKEHEFYRYMAKDMRLEVIAYPENQRYCVINNSLEEVNSIVYDGLGKPHSVQLAAAGLIWLEG